MNDKPTSVITGGRSMVEPNHLYLQALRLIKGTAAYEDRYIPNHEMLTELLHVLRPMGCVIAFTTGVWDLFHIGHGDYIQKGKDETKKLFPDAEHYIMIVGVDTDELTKSRKGPERPIVPMDERCKVLAHLRAVDIIVPQYELNQLYALIKPDVQIVSTSTKDLPPDLQVASQHCAHLINLPPQAETSTTARVRRLTFDGRIEMFGRLRTKMEHFLEELQNELGEK